MKAETAKPPRKARAAQQRAFDGFRSKYNQERPHEALEQEPPARHYRPSPRSYPTKVRSPEYGFGAVFRRVRTNGEIKWGGVMVYLSGALRGEPVGLVPRNERRYAVCFGPLVIGVLDTYTEKA